VNYIGVAKSLSSGFFEFFIPLEKLLHDYFSDKQPFLEIRFGAVV